MSSVESLQEQKQKPLERKPNNRKIVSQYLQDQITIGDICEMIEIMSMAEFQTFSVEINGQIHEYFMQIRKHKMELQEKHPFRVKLNSLRKILTVFMRIKRQAAQSLQIFQKKSHENASQQATVQVPDQKAQDLSFWSLFKEFLELFITYYIVFYALGITFFVIGDTISNNSSTSAKLQYQCHQLNHLVNYTNILVNNTAQTFPFLRNCSQIGGTVRNIWSSILLFTLCSFVAYLIIGCILVCCKKTKKKNDNS